jgi:hypothetical protein
LSFVAKWRAGTYAIIAMKNSIYSDICIHLIEKHNAETFNIKKLQFWEKEGVLGYTTVSYKFKPLDDILAFFRFFRITSCINPKHKYHLENFSSRDDIGRG